MEPYLEYITKVLGINSVLMKEDSQNFRQLQVIDLLFVNMIKETSDSIQEPKVADLLDKMKIAMKLGSMKVLAIDYSGKSAESLYSDIHQAFDVRFVIVMSREPMGSGDLRIMGPSLWMETFSPAHLLENSGTKKLVWMDLQKMMKRFKS